MLPQQIPLEKVRNLPQSISRMFMRAHVKHLIQLFESFAFRLRQEEEDEEESGDIPGCVPRESALGGKGGLERWPRNTEDEVEEPGGGGRKGHAEWADVQGISLGGIGERDRTFAGRVNDAEKVDPKGNAGDSGRMMSFVRDEETETGEE